MAFESKPISDGELARRTQNGSLHAFEALVYRYEGRLYAFVTHCCRNNTDAREVTQDSFVRAFQAIGQFDPNRSFAAWLFTIARRKCIDRQRAPKPLTCDALEGEMAPEADPSELLARREEQRDLWDLARQVLPDAQFQALWLRYSEEMNVAGIAQVLAKTRTHVKVLLFRAREALGRRLKSARTIRAPGQQVEVRRDAAFPKVAAAQCTAVTARKGVV